MAAKDYKICPALFNAYIAKVSKRDPSLMLEDRRIITKGEILALIDWYLDEQTEYGECGLAFDSLIRKGYQVELKFKKKEAEK